MKLKIASLIVYAIASLALGTYGAWYFSNLESISRMLKDLFSMFFLLGGLICAGIFIIAVLRQIENPNSNKNSKPKIP